MEFELGQNVKIIGSQEVGRIIGRAQYVHAEPNYLVRYKSADGRAVESWWTVSALLAE